METDPRALRMLELKREFDSWFARFRQLLSDPYTIDEESELVNVLARGRELQANLLAAIETITDSDDNS